MLNNLFIGLIQNSNISFNINDLFSLDAYSFTGIFIIGLMLFSFFLVTDKIVTMVRKLGLTFNMQLIIFLSVIAVYTVLSHLLNTRDLIMILWPAVLIIFIARLRKTPNSNYVFSGAVILVSLFAFSAVHVFTKYRDIKELDNRKIFAEKLAAEQDPLAEHLFTEVEEKIKSDSTLLNPGIYMSGIFSEKNL